MHERRREREAGELLLPFSSLALRLHKIHRVDRGRAGRARREADGRVRRPERRHESHGRRHEQREQDAACHVAAATARLGLLPRSRLCSCDLRLSVLV